jgi:hypothetical protein
MLGRWAGLQQAAEISVEIGKARLSGLHVLKGTHCADPVRVSSDRLFDAYNLLRSG